MKLELLMIKKVSYAGLIDSRLFTNTISTTEWNGKVIVNGKLNVRKQAFAVCFKIPLQYSSGETEEYNEKCH